MSDLEIVDAIKKNDNTTVNLAYRFMYRNYYLSIEKYITENRGSEQDAKDIFQDVMIILINNIRNEKYRNEAKLSSYLYGIARNKWLNKLRRIKLENIDRRANPMDHDIVDHSQHTQLEYTNMQIALGKLLKQAGDRCYELLKAFYYERQSMTEIAELMGFSSGNVAKNTKARCLKKIKISVANNDLYTDID